MYKAILILIFVAVWAVAGYLWGAAAQDVIDRKGYHESWVWKGFFLGPTALTLANAREDISSLTKRSAYGEGSWVCTCGKRMTAETEACTGCGKAKSSQ